VSVQLVIVAMVIKEFQRVFEDGCLSESPCKFVRTELDNSLCSRVV
jgi:hypothetical protein